MGIESRRAKRESLRQANILLEQRTVGMLNEGKLQQILGAGILAAALITGMSSCSKDDIKPNKELARPVSEPDITKSGADLDVSPAGEGSFIGKGVQSSIHLQGEWEVDSMYFGYWDGWNKKWSSFVKGKASGNPHYWFGPKGMGDYKEDKDAKTGTFVKWEIHGDSVIITMDGKTARYKIRSVSSDGSEIILEYYELDCSGINYTYVAIRLKKIKK